MTTVGELLRNVWNEAYQEKIATRIVAFAVRDHLIREAPKVLKHLETQASKLEARLAALERRRGVRS